MEGMNNVEISTWLDSIDEMALVLPFISIDVDDKDPNKEWDVVCPSNHFDASLN